MLAGGGGRPGGDGFQSSTYRGRHCNYLKAEAKAGGFELSVLYLSRKALQPVAVVTPCMPLLAFQSSTYRGRHCNLKILHDSAPFRLLSVLYLSRKALQL